MKRLIGAVAILALLSFVSTASAAVAVWDDYAEQERYVGEASSIKFDGQNVSSDGSQVTVLANGHKNGVTQNVSTETNLDSAALAYGVVQLYPTAGTKYISLADGTPGQMLTLIYSLSDNNEIVITDDKVAGANAITQTGWSNVYLNALYDQVTLLYVDDVYGWVIIGQYGVTTS